MRDLCPLQAVCVSAATFAVAAVASSQAVDTGRAVDPNVGDRGPNAASLRVVEPGLAQHPFTARVTTTDFRSRWSPFQAADPIATDPATGLPHSQGFQFTAPGVRALMDRPDYLVDVGGDQAGLNVQPVADGRQVLIIPANTVFQLTPERPRVEAATPPPVAANFVDLRFSPRPVESAPLHTPVSFSVDGQDTHALQIDASQLRFPAAALAAQPTDIPTADAPELTVPETESEAPAEAAEEPQPDETTAE